MPQYDALHIVDRTEQGMALLQQSPKLQEVLEIFGGLYEPFKARIHGMRLLGAGKYGFTFLVDGFAVKVTSPTSSQEAFQRKAPWPPEDLREQFTVLTAFGEHLQGVADDIGVPQQYLVAHTPHDAYVLVQEYLAGWESLVLGVQRTFPDEEDPSAVAAVRQLVVEIRDRLFRAISGFALADRIDDLHLHHPHGLHRDNLLVPQGAALTAAVPLRIIDQPGHAMRESKRVDKIARNP